MSGAYPLAVSKRVLRTLIVVNAVLGALILALLVTSLVAEDVVMGALGVRPGEGYAQLVRGGRLIMILGILSVPLAHIVLSRLLTIVRTVSSGDPFVAGNAARLETMAWSILGLEVLHVAVGVVAAVASSESAPFDVNWSFSLTRWLAVLLLFVLARVFEEGARMRADLEGTV